MKRALKTFRVLWAGMLASSVLFFVLQLMLRPDHEPPPLTFAIVLGGVAATMAVGSAVVPRALYKRGLGRLVHPTPEVSDPTRLPGLTPGHVAADPQGALTTIFGVYSVPFVLGLGLAESVGLFGFVLGFLGFPLGVVAPFFILCWGIHGVRYPTVESIVGPAEAVLGVPLPRD
jgi:hypothetical protein